MCQLAGVVLKITTTIQPLLPRVTSRHKAFAIVGAGEYAGKTKFRTPKNLADYNKFDRYRQWNRHRFR